MGRTIVRALRNILLPGMLIGILVGLVVGLLDGGAFTAWAMFLGGLAGAASSAAGIIVGALAMFLLRNASARSRRLGTAVGVGLGAGGMFLILAKQAHLVAPWQAVGALLVLATAGSWAYARYSTRSIKVDSPA